MHHRTAQYYATEACAGPSHADMLRPALPRPYTEPVVWLKGDIVVTVAFHRLRFLFGGWGEGDRDYDIRVLDRDTFARVQKCVRAGLGL